MAVRVVGIVGSPRKGMNTDSLVSAALDGARSAGAQPTGAQPTGVGSAGVRLIGVPSAGAEPGRVESTGAESAGVEVEKIYLNDLSIRPCQACAEFPEERYCRFEDGMNAVYRGLDEADAVVIGTPAYFGDVSAQLKLMIDRCNCLARMMIRPDGGLTFRTRMGKRKKGLLIWVAHLSKDVAVAQTPVRLWCRFTNIDLVDTVVFTGSDGPDAAVAREDALREAFEAGARLLA